jgi:hypothetical protein
MKKAILLELAAAFGYLRSFYWRDLLFTAGTGSLELMFCN